MNPKYSARKTEKLLTALTDNKLMVEGRNKILENQAFKKLMELPEEELKALGTERNASKLIKMYKRELGLMKKKEVERQMNVKQNKKENSKNINKEEKTIKKN